ncbi:hypothetical protein NHF40_03815 [Maricaulaceae bacterium EIL42A08]|nr:hypothetical protein [Maricaulaceae bacterium EIL42A08]MCP2679362.1 hypothetical protein [Maricaulaceae bacterium NA33B04]
MEFLDPIMPYIDPVWSWLMAGLAAFGPQTAGGDIAWIPLGIQMGVIGVVMALLMPSYGAILVFTIASTIVHVVVDEAMPIILDGASFAMPPVTDMAYLQYISFAAAAYLVGLTVLYIIKAIVLPR